MSARREQATNRRPIRSLLPGGNFLRWRLQRQSRAGGYGAILRYNGHEKEIRGGEAHTTNNRMELTAAMEALRLLTRPCRITIVTDSQYLVKG